MKEILKKSQITSKRKLSNIFFKNKKITISFFFVKTIDEVIQIALSSHDLNEDENLKVKIKDSKL